MKKRKSKKEDTMLEVICKATFMSVVVLIIIGVLCFRILLQWGDGLLSYVGAIIGGGLTLIGVAITIYYQDIRRKEERDQRERERKTDLALQFRPILKITAEYENDKILDNKIPTIIKFNNIGRGEAINIHSIIENSIGGDKNLIDKIRFLPFNETISVHETLFALFNYKSPYKGTSYRIITTYTDIYNYSSYTLITKIYIRHDENTIERINCTNSISSSE